MTLGTDLVEITSVDELTELNGTPSGRSVAKERRRLHELDRKWLAASPLCLIATSDADGNCDVSPKGDPPGFALVLDDTTIAIPERPGNKRMDGFRNILANPHVGLIFLIPGRRETLRVNGRARLVREAPFLDDMVVKGHRPVLAVVVEIDQVFHHCGKALMRSSLWKPEAWPEDGLPSHARITKAVMDIPETVEELERHYGPGYDELLYRAR